MLNVLQNVKTTMYGSVGMGGHGETTHSSVPTRLVESNMEKEGPGLVESNIGKEGLRPVESNC